MVRRVWMVTVASILTCVSAHAAPQQGSVSGSVLDPLGAGVPAAEVALLREGDQVAETTSGSDGRYTFQNVASGRYQIRARATGFAPQTSEAIFVGGSAAMLRDVRLQVGPLAQQVVVTASAAPVSQSQTGAPVTVIDEDLLESLNTPDVLEALRNVPGAHAVQTGARGGPASLFIRGGNPNFAKVLMDGVAANDIGGGFDFSQVATTGVSRIEVLRQSNSVVYGADALAGVVNIETKRGSTRIPEVGYSIDGGNLGMFRDALSVGGAVKRFDYFSEFSYFRTDNVVPNNEYTNATFAGRFGVQLGRGSDLSGVVRHASGDVGSPNGITLYGVPDDASQTTELTYAGVTLQSQWGDRLQTTLRLGNTDQTTSYRNPTPTGEAFDPFGFGANYLGERVTLTGGNGYTVTGRGILDFGGTYPSTFDSRSTRRTVSGQVTYTVAPAFSVSTGGRVEREQGYSNLEDDPTTTRDNGGVFFEGRGSLGSRSYVSAGIGYERNEAFASAVTPRLSLATYLHNPAPGSIGETKLSLNAGRGIKAPAVFQVESSVFALLQSVTDAPHVDPIGPEKGTSIDIGVEQGLWDGRARLRVAWFHNRYEDLIEFVAKNVLPQVGVPAAVAQATPFGAYVNSQSYTAKGVEASAEALLAGRLRLLASYTRLNAEVTESLSSGALSPAINPSFPGIPIGAFSALVGGRPFRRPANAGSVTMSYTAGPAQAAVSAYFSGKRDDSTFVTDAFFGNSMLLPNKDLDPAYQTVDLSGSYEIHRRVRPYVSIENLFNRKYEASFGFPALPRTVRAGLAVTFGGGVLP
jgi:vitamin B12 transporter